MPETTPGLSAFFEAWDLFREPALAGAVAGALLGMLGIYVVLRRMVFLSAALSQSASLGVSLAWFAQVRWSVPAWIASPTTGGTAASLLAAAIVWLLIARWVLEISGSALPRVLLKRLGLS